jgi:hypothetical protein
MQALEPAATQYRRQLLRAAVALLSVAWGTQGVLGVQAEEATMCSVEMPPLRCSQQAAASPLLLAVCDCASFQPVSCASAVPQSDCASNSHNASVCLAAWNASCCFCCVSAA